jgi:hypothetical protein
MMAKANATLVGASGNVTKATKSAMNKTMAAVGMAPAGQTEEIAAPPPEPVTGATPGAPAKSSAAAAFVGSAAAAAAFAVLFV